MPTLQLANLERSDKAIIISPITISEANQEKGRLCLLCANWKNV